MKVAHARRTVFVECILPRTPALEQRVNKLHDVRTRVRAELEAPPALRRFGTGWISGVLGIVLGIAGLALVTVLRLPGVFATAEAQGLHQDPWFRAGLHVLLLGGFGCALVSLTLRREKVLGTCGALSALLAAMLGGSTATPLAPDVTPLYLGLVFFVLQILFTGLLFVPLERLFAHRREQPIFRGEWREDLFYFLVSSLLVQILTFLTFVPAKTSTPRP